MKFNKWREWREQSGLTLQQVEDKSGFCISKLSRVEAGKIRLSAPEAYFLKRILILAIAERNGEKIAE